MMFLTTAEVLHYLCLHIGPNLGSLFLVSLIFVNVSYHTSVYEEVEHNRRFSDIINDPVYIRKGDDMR